MPVHSDSASSNVEEGLGNACLLQLPDGTFGVIDWGTQSEDALETFFDAVDGPIAFIAATHAHADHTLGLPRLLEACGDRGVPVGRFVYPASSLHKEQRHLTLARTMARTLDVRTSAVHVDDFGGPAGLMGAALSGVRRGMARARAESTE